MNHAVPPLMEQNPGPGGIMMVTHPLVMMMMPMMILMLAAGENNTTEFVASRQTGCLCAYVS